MLGYFSLFEMRKYSFIGIVCGLFIFLESTLFYLYSTANNLKVANCIH